MKLKLVEKLDEFINICLTEGLEMSDNIMEPSDVDERRVVDNNIDTTSFFTTHTDTFIGLDTNRYTVTTTNYTATSITKI